jgi:hypothetical protein
MNDLEENTVNAHPAVDPDADVAALDVAARTDGAPQQSPAERGALTHEMDALSLTQALLDFEMANARVLDLTARLVEANARVIKLQTTVDETSVHRAALEAEFAAQRNELTAELNGLRIELDQQRAAVSSAQQQTALAQAELAATHASKTFRVARAIKRLTGRTSK